MKKKIKEWIDIADKDIRAAHLILQDENLTGTVSFHCQQAIEKYFKGYLLENGWKLKKTHNLRQLYDEIKKIKDMKLDEKTLSEINESYAETRYPDFYFAPSPDQARKFLEFAQKVQRTIKQEIGFPQETPKT